MSTPIFGLTTTIIFAIIFVSSLIYKIFFDKENKSKKFSWFLYLTLLGNLLLLWIAFCAPHFFIELPRDFSQNESLNISGTINNLMSPFIAITAAILTFLAFWVQHHANQEMLKNNEKQQNERQFYEMLKLHRENVNALEWKILKDETEYDCYLISREKNGILGKLAQHINRFALKNFISIKKLDHISCKGQSVLRLYLNEFTLALKTLKLLHYNDDKVFFKAYEIFFEGLDNTEIDIKSKKYLKLIRQATNRGQDVTNLIPDEILAICKKQGRCNIFEGHRDVLNSYYRHLYNTVRATANSKHFNEDEKLNYLKILRAQMTSEEQALLLFNWQSGYGTEWEKEFGNRFFSHYKMIHNIELCDTPYQHIQEVFNLFAKENKISYLTREEKVSLFEFFERKYKQKHPPIPETKESFIQFLNSQIKKIFKGKNTMTLKTWQTAADKDKWFDRKTIQTNVEFNNFLNQIKSKVLFFRGIKDASFKQYSSIQRFLEKNQLKKSFDDFVNQSILAATPLYQKYYPHTTFSQLTILSFLQHYGYPTPLLDFTIDINTALFFALDGATSHGKNNTLSDYISIYALDIEPNQGDLFNLRTVISNKNIPVDRASLVNYNTAASWKQIIALSDHYQKNDDYSLQLNLNININAQKGLFVLNPTPDKTLDDWFDGRTMWNITDSTNDLLYGKMKCWDIHKSLIPHIQSILQQNGINKASIYPDTNESEIKNALDDILKEIIL